MRKLLLLMFVLVSIVTGAKAQEAYAVFTNNQVTFYYDNLKAIREGAVDINPDFRVYRSFSIGKVKKAVFDPSFAGYRPTTTAYWFYTCAWMESIEGLQYLNTEEVTNMTYMFSHCEALTSLDLHTFNTSKVTNMSSMFSDCFKLTSLDVSSFDTRNVTTTRKMFYDCENLTSLDVSNFNTSNVRDMVSMFYGLEKLATIKLGNFNTSNISDMRTVFGNCKQLTSLDLSSFDTRNVTTMNSMFENCKNLKSLDLSNFNTENVADMDNMFHSCEALTNLDLSSFNTHKVITMEYMFGYCRALTSINLGSFNTEKVTNMSRMLEGCSSLTSLDLSSFNTRNVTDMALMFDGCYVLTTIYASEGWTTAKVKESSMFEDCNELVGQLGTAYGRNVIRSQNDPHVRTGYARIDRPTAPGYFTSKDYTISPVMLTGNSDGKGYYWASYYNNVAGFKADANTTVYIAKLSDDKTTMELKEVTDNTKVELTEVTDKSVPTGSAVILKSNTEEIVLTYDLTATDELPANDLKGQGFEAATPDACYILACGSNGVGFYPWTGSTVPAHCSYITLSDTASTCAFIPLGGAATGISLPNCPSTTTAGAIYTLDGHKVAKGKLQKGVYIVNGKKLFIK